MENQHYVKSVHIWSVFSHTRTEYEETECGKIQMRKTPNTDNLYALDLPLAVLQIVNDLLGVNKKFHVDKTADVAKTSKVQLRLIFFG